MDIWSNPGHVTPHLLTYIYPDTDLTQTHPEIIHAPSHKFIIRARCMAFRMCLVLRAILYKGISYECLLNAGLAGAPSQKACHKTTFSNTKCFQQYFLVNMMHL